MEENNGIATVMKVLGEKIIQLESDLSYERLCKENAEHRAANLAEENANLARKLEGVQHYIERMEAQYNGDH